MSFVLSKEQESLVKAKTNSGRVSVGFRPQAVQTGKDGPGSFKGTVYAFNPFVTYGVLIIEVEGTKLRVLTNASEHFEVDQTVSARIDPKDIYLFDEATTTNLVYL
jgi:ABC-type sugar transport system ATPase subunit